MLEILSILLIINKCEKAMKNGAVSKKNAVASDHMNCVIYGDEEGYNPEKGYTDYELESPITSEYMDGEPILSCWYRKYNNSANLSEIHLLFSHDTGRLHITITPEGWKEVQAV